MYFLLLLLLFVLRKPRQFTISMPKETSKFFYRAIPWFSYKSRAPVTLFLVSPKSVCAPILFTLSKRESSNLIKKSVLQLK